jgi:hypothetical protein
MSNPVDFLQSVARAATALSLYRPGHPSARRATGHAFDALQTLRTHGPLAFMFLGEDVLFNNVPLRPLRGWPWANRLARAGVQRIEIDQAVSRDEFDTFLGDLAQRVAISGEAERPAPAPHRHIRFGPAALAPDGAGFPQPAAPPGQTVSLMPELDVVVWLHGHLQEHGTLPVLEARTLIGALTAARQSQPGGVLPRVDAGPDSSLSAHALNVASLTMSLAETLACSSNDVFALGLGALLHDVAKVRWPAELCGKPCSMLDASEQAMVESHPADSARLILRSDPRLELAAIVAYEHHMGLDGTGYPKPSHPREPFWGTRILQVANEYDRWCQVTAGGRASEAALRQLHARVGQALDPALVAAFAEMIRRSDFGAIGEPHREPPAGRAPSPTGVRTARRDP